MLSNVCNTGPCSAVGSESNCRSRGEFDPAQFHTFVEIDSPSSADSKRIVVSDKRKYVLNA